MPAFPSWNAIIYTNSVIPVAPSPAQSLGTHEALPGGTTGATGSGSTSGAGSVVSNGSSLWSVYTPLGTEPGAAAIVAVTRNVTGLDDPEVGNLFEQVLSDLNANGQQLLLSKLDAQLSHDLPTIPLFQEPVSLVQQSDIVNVSESPTWAGPMWDAQDWAIQLSPPLG
jgi:ABC-type transport system substrate-binding protein